jgi:hypothetical protein
MAQTAERIGVVHGVMLQKHLFWRFSFRVFMRWSEFLSTDELSQLEAVPGLASSERILVRP